MDFGYNPNLTECYSCHESLKDGDWIIGYFEHYMHGKCAPLFIVETADLFQWRAIQATRKGEGSG